MLIYISGCKKQIEYKLSPSIKEYFTFKPGSYWIYRNDSTGELDSTYVKYFSIHIQENDEQLSTREVLVIDFNSLFLKRLEVIVNSCKQNNYAAVSGRDLSGIHTDGGVFYYSDWPQEKVIIPECEPGIKYYYKLKSIDTINNQIYHDVLFTEIKCIDSSFQYYHFRRISYSKHFGVIKYYDLLPPRNITSSFTLIRCKIIK